MANLLCRPQASAQIFVRTHTHTQHPRWAATLPSRRKEVGLRVLLRPWLNYQGFLDLNFPICKLKRRIRYPLSSNSILYLKVNERKRPDLEMRQRVTFLSQPLSSPDCPGKGTRRTLQVQVGTR